MHYRDHSKMNSAYFVFVVIQKTNYSQWRVSGEGHFFFYLSHGIQTNQILDIGYPSLAGPRNSFYRVHVATYPYR